MKQAKTLLIGATLLGGTLAAGAALAQTTPAETQPPPSQTQTQDEDEQQDASEQNMNEQEETEQEDENVGDGDGEENDGEENDDTEEMDEAEEADDAPNESAPVALGDYGKVSFQDAISAAQAELGTQSAPFEATLERVDGTLAWAVDFVSPPMQVVLDANTGAVLSRGELSRVPTADAALTAYGSVSLADAVRAAQNAYGSPAEVTEVALEKDAQNGNVLTWRVDVGDKLVVLDADSGQVLSTGPLN